MRKCPKCNKPVPYGARRCMNCRTVLTDSTSSSSSEYDAASRSNAPTIADEIDLGFPTSKHSRGVGSSQTMLGIGMVSAEDSRRSWDDESSGEFSPQATISGMPGITFDPVKAAASQSSSFRSASRSMRSPYASSQDSEPRIQKASGQFQQPAQFAQSASGQFQQPQQFRQPSQSLQQPTQFRQPSQALQQPAQFRQPSQALQQPAQFRQPSQALQQPAQFRQSSQAIQQPAQFRQPSQALQQPAQFRQPSQAIQQPPQFAQALPSMGISIPSEISGEGDSLFGLPGIAPAVVPSSLVDEEFEDLTANIFGDTFAEGGFDDEDDDGWDFDFNPSSTVQNSSPTLTTPTPLKDDSESTRLDVPQFEMPETEEGEDNSDSIDFVGRSTTSHFNALRESTMQLNAPENVEQLPLQTNFDKVNIFACASAVIVLLCVIIGIVINAFENKQQGLMVIASAAISIIIDGVYLFMPSSASARNKWLAAFGISGLILLAVTVFAFPGVWFLLFAVVAQLACAFMLFLKN